MIQRARGESVGRLGPRGGRRVSTHYFHELGDAERPDREGKRRQVRTTRVPAQQI